MRQRSVFSQLKDFPGAKNIKADPKDNDKDDLEDAKTDGVIQKTGRREIDADNSRKINETMKTRSMTKDDPVINGITDNGDVFYSRPEPIPDTERKRIYREALQQQKGETRTLRKKEEDEELEYGARARYEIEEKKGKMGRIANSKWKNRTKQTHTQPADDSDSLKMGEEREREQAEELEKDKEMKQRQRALLLT
ncbi:hypothetical protein BLNAU_1453 [Blattamonas nauphoetae]|uniref:Uncharacterized protein n=1 Tax=Blattamonas nauphoetae TaxID=2049346 RepID=A0ABQ9YI26_9EUKA|nr:hypothetical protein BLNAU_1453 [Blattamonas nauphoetae]